MTAHEWCWHLATYVPIHRDLGETQWGQPEAAADRVHTGATVKLSCLTLTQPSAAAAGD